MKNIKKMKWLDYPTKLEIQVKIFVLDGCRSLKLSVRSVSSFSLLHFRVRFLLDDTLLNFISIFRLVAEKFSLFSNDFPAAKRGIVRFWFFCHRSVIIFLTCRFGWRLTRSVWWLGKWKETELKFVIVSDFGDLTVVDWLRMAWSYVIVWYRDLNRGRTCNRRVLLTE